MNSALTSSPTILTCPAPPWVLCWALLHRVILGIHWEEKAVIATFLEVLVLNLHILKREPPNLFYVIVSCAVAWNFRRLRFLHFVEVFEDLLVKLLHNHLLVGLVELSRTHKVVQGFCKGCADGCQTISWYTLKLLLLVLFNHFNNYNWVGSIYWASTFI